MKIETRTEPPEPDVDDDGDDGGEQNIHVVASLYTPAFAHSASAFIGPDSAVPMVATAICGVVRGPGHTHSPALGEMVDAMLVDTGRDAGIWINRPDVEIATMPAESRLTLSTLDHIAAAHRRGHRAPLAAIRFHPGTVVPLDAIRAVLKAAGAV